MKKKKKIILGIIITHLPIIFIFFILLLVMAAAAGSAGEQYSKNEYELDDDNFQFIFRIVEYNYDARKKYNVLTSVTVAQAIVESGWGKSTISQEANNLFGMKGNYYGQSYTAKKGEIYRKYPTWNESVEDHARLLCNKNYQCNNIKNYKKVLKNLKSGGYSESKDYIEKIEQVIVKYNLTQYDDLSSEQLKQIKDNSYITVNEDNSYISNGSSEKGKAIAEMACTRIGYMYKWGGCHTMKEIKNPNSSSFDCSGLVCWAHYQCGIKVTPMNTTILSGKGKKVSRNSLSTGDIIIFSNNGKYTGIHHVGIYIGQGKMVHAPRTGKPIQITSITKGYYNKQFYCARRLY